MQVKNATVHEFLSRLRLYFQENDVVRKYANEPPPLRAELFNTIHMEQHGRSLAKIHRVSTKRAPDFLLKRLADNEKILHEVRNLLADSIKEKHLITPGAEWILDNFYLIEEQIRTGKRHFPKGYSEGLPRLINRHSQNLPRVYDIVLEIISHSDGRIDLENLASFIQAYQEVTTLQLGELWAIPIMLRLALIENLRRVSARIAIDRINQNLADYWSGQMIETSEKDPKSLILVIADMARSFPPMESSFVAELTRQLMWKGPALTLPLTWMEQRLSESGITSAELVNLENQKQAADQVSISNSIGSLRFVSSMEWRDCIESMSKVESTLRKDIGGIYGKMNFSTRDHYRHIIEKTAKYSKLTETEVAEVVIQLAKENAEKNGTADRRSHVGYYLVGKGLAQTKTLANLNLPLPEALRKYISRFPVTFYAGSLILITAALSGIAILHEYDYSRNYGLLVLTGILSLIGASQLTLALVNWLTTLVVKPNILPRMDFSSEIPAEFKTIVVVPTMLTSEEGFEALAEGLEIRFLANRTENIYYGLLTDFADAKEETLPGDAALMDLAQKKIEGLNEKYSKGKDIFFLFHRPRVWNASDRIWMGYERKRGKLTALNALLSNGTKENFSLITGDLEVLKNTRYVITLDTDTQLPRDAGWKMIATMAHPLNQPLYDEKRSRVTEGYGILQPRMAITLPRSAGSLYNRMHSNEAGIDPYTRLTSDVYQDMFCEGSFIGKGIYEIKTFEKALNNRFPDNRILSHDLLEGCYARSGLQTDIQLYEEYPSRYTIDVSRRHRWIRGDWQIAWWFLPIVPDANRRFIKNPLSTLSRWKIFDNLRRSLVSPALSLLLLSGWTFLKAPCFWTLSVIAVILVPSIISSLWGMLKRPRETTYKQHLISSMSILSKSLLQNVYTLVCLPFEAYYSMDAIVRTSWRIIVSHKYLLEWKPSGNLETGNEKNIISAFKSMWASPFIAIAVTVYLSIYYPASLIASFPLLVLWITAPAITWWVSNPPAKKDAKISAVQRIFLRRIARKTWGFFENFVTIEDNWLPPDNYQEHPREAIAHRTSPTNIGLSLLSNLAAYDFGYIPAGTVIERTANTIKTMESMERFRGHYFNWYDTVTLAPLVPRYISSVDSGNLGGHILTLRQGLLALPGAPIISVKFIEGVQDTVSVLEEYMKESIPLKNLKIYLEGIRLDPPVTLESVKLILDRLIQAAVEIHNIPDARQNGDSRWWTKALTDQCRKLLDELYFLAPWIKIPPVPANMGIFTALSDISTLNELAALEENILPEIELLENKSSNVTENKWLNEIREAVREASRNAKERLANIEQLAISCNDIADMEYDFLYDKSKHLLVIGYNVDESRADPGCYDLLASEARLCTFVTIAQGKLPQESWFALGRLLTNTDGTPILLSWSGSIFEYIMPDLVMPDFENTILYQTNKAVVERQIEYGIQRGVPWGISESGYNMVDANLNYQYRAFGVPGLGLKRGLSDDLVIAPYASLMALMIAPYEACINLERLAADGFTGKFGFYEAIDYTHSRTPRGQSYALIQSFMAHHQGMGLLSLDHLLQNQPMQKRFQAELQFQATLLLLQERIPKATIPYVHTTDIAEVSFPVSNTEVRIINTPHTPIPTIQLLSNGKYNVMITNAGGGYSHWKEIAVTRWREDATCDNWGTFCYIRDLENNAFWSNTYQPTLKEPKKYEVTFTQGRAEFRREDNNIETHTEVVVSPEDDIELRRIHIKNRSRRTRTIEVTSYTEVVLNSQAADAIHPAFSKLFVQTEIRPEQHAVICTRRPRSVEEQAPWMCHIMKSHGIMHEGVSYETDRMEFIGRGNTTVSPRAMEQDSQLSGSQGSVLDPIVAIRYKLIIEPGQTAIIDLITGISDTREGCQALIDKYQDRHLTDRVLELSWTHSQVVLRQINATEADAQIYTRLASSVIFANPVLRADASTIIHNNKGQSGLWSYSISGDLPIVLLRIQDPNNIILVKQLIQAHAYWRLKGLQVDLVIWNEDHAGYRQNLMDQIAGLIAAGVGANFADRPGGIFVRSADQISVEDRTLFQTVARVIIIDDRGTLDDQLNRRRNIKNVIPLLSTTQSASAVVTVVPQRKDLLFFNGTGGFSPDGCEYIINTSKNHVTPAPWANVIANPNFGTVISESGTAYTWAENAHEYRITPWDNDPVSDTGGEVFYLRDEDSGQFWSPTPLPRCGKSAYITRHGFGYSVFEHIEDGISSEMWVYVDIEASIKFMVLKIKNQSGRLRTLSATGYVELILGDLKAKSILHIVTETDAATGAVFSRNPYNTAFPGRVAFFDVDETNRSFTTDRTEFIGRNGTLQDPDAMSRTKLSGKVGSSFDPCIAIQVSFDLYDEQEKEIVFRLGTGKNSREASRLVKQFKGIAAAGDSLVKVHEFWQNTLNAVQVETPDKSLNILANGWLTYQTLACRIWARSGYYQSGGAFGFRDQLQDVISLLHTKPLIARTQILLCASRQFKEGDVQHWWHPPTGRGVRTRCSDDFLWLPFAVCRYVITTGDNAILNESVHFLDGRLLNPGEESYYDLPTRNPKRATLYEHSVIAIRNGLQYGEHGLPLIGSGDWNDGMDKVGKDGKGESIWLGFFLYDILMKFTEIATLHGDLSFAEQCKTEAKKLQANLELHGWDGEWYRRAYFDNGSPLGAAANTECRIDSISQSWSVLSGAGAIDRARKGMQAVDKYLVLRDDGLIKLLDPPFDKSDMNPGYIKGYVPGVRENGGQYTHAAIWTTMAFAALGENERVWELFSMINPINHGSAPELINIYKVEPYVVAADVYAVAPHTGRGGWTWYTGSAGWMNYFILQSLLGFRLKADKLQLEPCIPAEWDSFKIHYRYRSTLYHIYILQVAASGKGMTMTVDSEQQNDNVISLVDDHAEHTVEVILHNIPKQQAPVVI